MRSLISVSIAVALLFALPACGAEQSKATVDAAATVTAVPAQSQKIDMSQGYWVFCRPPGNNQPPTTPPPGFDFPDDEAEGDVPVPEVPDTAGPVDVNMQFIIALIAALGGVGAAYVNRDTEAEEEVAAVPEPPAEE